jgi:hypothetical protein
MGDSERTAGVGGQGGSGPQVHMEDILGALALFMEQHRANQGGQGATKVLKSVVSNVERFDGKNISKFLRVYICEMEVHQVGEDRCLRRLTRWLSLTFVNVCKRFVRGVRFRKTRGFWLQLVSLAGPSNLQLSSKLPQSFKYLQNKTINKSYSLNGLLPTKICPSFCGRSKSQLFLCKS